MKAFAIWILLSAAFAAVIATSPIRPPPPPPPPKKHCCPVNEVWSDCSPPGRPCEKDCLNRDKEIGCAAVCTARCYCKKDYFRQTANGKCVPESECPGRG